jgi:hypothetical protein
LAGLNVNSLLQAWLLQSFVIFLIVGSLAGIAAGVLLLFRPQSLQRAGQLLNRWISTRHLDHSLERSFNIDPWFYRYRRAGGMLILLGAIYVLFFFTMSMDRAHTVDVLAVYFRQQAVLLGGLLDALVLSSILGASCAALVALFLMLRPSMLRDFEQVANQWVSLRRAMKPIEVRREGLDEYVFQRARVAGILLLLGGFYVLVILTLWLAHVM